MSFLPIFWLNSCIHCVLTSSQGLFKAPEYLSRALPAKVLSMGSNPLSMPTLPTVSTPFQPTIFKLSSSSIFLPAFAFLPGSEDRYPAINIEKSYVGVNSSTNTLAQMLCPAAIQQKDKITPVVPQFKSQSLLWLNASPKELPKRNLQFRIFQILENLFQWPKRVEASVNQIPVVIIRDNSYKPIAETESETEEGSRYQEWFQIWVKGRLIAYIPDRAKAIFMARSILNFLEDPSLNAEQLQPVIEKGKPGGKVGNHLLFEVDDELIKQINRDGDLLAIEWINNLRSALDAKPLNLVQAQTQMYNLVDTSEKIDGLASWYGGFFHGRLTANGERYNKYALTAAHKSLPFNTFLKVTNMNTGAAVIVRVNDRGPYIPPRSLDLSLGAARCVNSEVKGVIPYKAEFMQRLTSQ